MTKRIIPSMPGLSVSDRKLILIVTVQTNLKVRSALIATLHLIPS